MKFTLDYTRKDFEEAAKLIIRSSQTLGPIQRFSIYYALAYPKTCMLLGAVSFIVFGLLLIGITQGLLLGINVWLLMALGGLLSGLGWMLLYSSTFGRKKLIDYYLAHLPATQSTEIDISEHGVTYKSPRGEGVSKWETFTRAVYNNNFLLLYISPISMIVIPKRFLSPEEWEELISLVKLKVPDVQAKA
jgi:hypothetical protein